MPFLFLSPSTQEFNPYITEGNEEYWMNLLADRMEPDLYVSGVNTVRNDPAAGAAGAIRLSNQGDYDFHLALHSNASPEALARQQRGVRFFTIIRQAQPGFACRSRCTYQAHLSVNPSACRRAPPLPSARSADESAVRAG